MVISNQSLWNTLFGWMGPKQCMLPEGCIVPWKGVLVYVAIVVFVGTLLYWFRQDIAETAIGAVEWLKDLV